MHLLGRSMCCPVGLMVVITQVIFYNSIAVIHWAMVAQ